MSNRNRNSTDERLAAALPGALGPMFRLMRRAVAVGYRHPRLPDAQIELLRLVERRPGITVSDAAVELRVAPNTVSTLVRGLLESGLVERRRGRGDRRTSELHLTPEAWQQLGDWGEHRHRVLTEVVGSLRPEDREALAAALPALERLRAALEDRARRAG